MRSVSTITLSNTLRSSASNRFASRCASHNYQPADGSHPTSYLWRQAFQRDAWMDLLASFIHVEHPDPDDPLAAPTMIFPRFHQWDCVLRFVDDARQHGAGRNYLAMHSTGSGKTNTIGWLAHRLANLFDADDRKVFDKVIVLTDRTVLDRQLQDKIEQFEQVKAAGMVRAISDSSQQLREALESSSAKVIVSTIQKFPYISSSLTDRRGERFAIVIDEAHSSQSGESSAAVKRALAPSRTESEETLLAQAAEEEAHYEAAEPDPTLAAAEAARARGPQDNLSMFAFTATPKNRTLELFGGTEPATGHKRPSHVYSMRQAIEEGFILDVLQNYTTYDTYYRLATATVQWDSETVEKSKALAAVRRFAMLHPHNIAQKVAIIVEHFRENVMGGLDGQAKAMVVTASRLHAVRYKHKIDEYLTANGYHDLRALIAFSGEVIDPDGDPDHPYTEAHMNGFPEGQTTKRFDSDDYQVMVVAEKYQTGFDQPKLCAMYVDKKLAGVNVVQTFSRLNRPLPGKTTFILDFVNDVDTIRDAYADYWSEALAEPTDPQALYETWERLDDYHVLDDEDVDRFAAVWFDPTFDPMATSDDKKKAARKHQQLTDALAPAEKRFAALAEEQQDEFRSVLNQFVRMYSFLAQVLPWSDPDLEKRHAYARLLSRRVADERGKALDLSDELEMTHYHLQQSFHGKVEPGDSEVIGPTFSGSGHGALTEEEQAALADIIARINDRFGAGLDEQHRVIAEGMAHHVLADEDAQSKLAANPQDKAWIAFEQMWSKAKYAYLDEHTEFIKTLVDQPEIEKMLGKAVFDYVYREARRRQSQDIEGEPSAT
ncbi:MAG: restriction endonuclease subunit R [Actinobacteria bacterium QS_8_72_14]|nr:MAG: restriction endonuclease subunit R [Actinobacteria bacterium QS_8_72_14]